ncbi:MAG TPA: L,D-transpeptidase family protein [Candidatus Paceibacterota bacterium]
MSRTDDPHPLIKRFRSMGMSETTIFNRLILEGWAEEDIRHAFLNRPGSKALPAQSREAAHGETWSELEEEVVEVASRKRFSLVTLSISVLVASGIGASAYFYFKPPATYSISIPSAAASVAPELAYGALPAISDPDYYASVKADLVAERGSFIDANLSSMQLTVYRGGQFQIQVPIKAKGKVGSWWETPAGIYKIETKERTHFSTMGEVDMPYSLDFQGNFFIHGWPTYKDGTPVSSTYSGGCIRLSTEDAAKVFDLVDVGMPVIVYNEEPAPDPFAYSLKAPSISASSYLVADLDSGSVLTERQANTPAAIASITKLVTALVATEYINLDKQLTVQSSALVYTAVPRLKSGQSFRAYDLLFLLLQESSNEAAETLAQNGGREQFIGYMNKKAQAIGLTNTTFSDPSGAKDDISTPEDLFKLLGYIYDNRRFVFGITTGEISDSAYGKSVFGQINNFNKIKNSSAKLLGGKIGQTNEAGETYAGVFSVKVGDTERRLAVIVLDSKDAQADVSKLLNFVHSSYAPAQ